MIPENTVQWSIHLLFDYAQFHRCTVTLYPGISIYSKTVQLFWNISLKGKWILNWNMIHPELWLQWCLQIGYLVSGFYFVLNSIVLYAVLNHPLSRFPQLCSLTAWDEWHPSLWIANQRFAFHILRLTVAWSLCFCSYFSVWYRSSCLLSAALSRNRSVTE